MRLPCFLVLKRRKSEGNPSVKGSSEGFTSSNQELFGV